jgi:predicted O-methyltransferase YrrM
MRRWAAVRSAHNSLEDASSLLARGRDYLTWRLERSDPYLRYRYGVTPDESRAAFVDRFFDDDEYERYIEEFRNGYTADMLEEALGEFRRMAGNRPLYGIGLDHGANYYALLRSLEPETVVETGVCNGLSSTCALLALGRNGRGTLHSIDYPLYADEDLEEFRAETFEAYGGAAIPADRDPGWIVPEGLRQNWDLRIGKSQRELPALLAEIPDIDVFTHDSEHSLPCMIFEYELAWEWLRSGGVLLSDDISWNDAWKRFVTVRDCDFGLLSHNFAYAVKDR